MDWINLKDKKPEIYEFVLVCANNKGTNEPKPVSIARITSDTIIEWDFLAFLKKGAFWDIEYPIMSDDITHWMPLPKPP